METKAEDVRKSAFVHVPVLSRELVEYLDISPDGHYLDATVGGGGHSQLILAAAPDVQVTAIDQDIEAIAAAKAKLVPYGNAVQFWHGNFAQYQPGEILFDGIIADLGVSSAQLDLPERCQLLLVQQATGGIGEDDVVQMAGGRNVAAVLDVAHDAAGADQLS
ncbi:MAG: 16S rRNA (cytosine(1402)-N(4))-methyltransferase, partial [Symploca sp. SIO1B1]|nr:16S rRNA (cytosine(1402)-N(4))-methyltransferase [Symploca sp. SIO1B1]